MLKLNYKKNGKIVFKKFKTRLKGVYVTDLSDNYKTKYLPIPENISPIFDVRIKFTWLNKILYVTSFEWKGKTPFKISGKKYIYTPICTAYAYNFIRSRASSIKELDAIIDDAHDIVECIHSHYLSAESSPEIYRYIRSVLKDQLLNLVWVERNL